MAVRVELLTVGDELLRGDTANGNATWLGRRLTEAGAEVTRSAVVPDVLDVIAGAVGAAFTVSVKLWVALEPTPFAAVIVIG